MAPERPRVTKTMWPGQPGAQRAHKAHGDALVCVRYRQDQAGLRRYTTIELIVDAGPLTPGRPARSWPADEAGQASTTPRPPSAKNRQD